MSMILKKLTLNAFKGVKEGVFEFADNLSVICGRNGVGKTTLFTAFLWLLCGKDANLTSNPAVFPIDEGEYTPTVIAEVLIDGKPVTLQKSQKRKVSKPNEDGISKVTYSNSYEINSVELSERDFKAGLLERGIDPEKLAVTLHTDSFIGMDKKQQRAILFNLFGISDLNELLAKARKSKLAIPKIEEKVAAGYKINEIESMAKASIRKINEVYGKDGEILGAKIEGLCAAKTNIEESREELDNQEKGLNTKRTALYDEVAEKNAALDESIKSAEETLKGFSTIVENIRAKITLARNTLALERRNKAEQLRTISIELTRSMNDKNSEISHSEQRIWGIDQNLNTLESEIKTLEEKSKSKAICPLCHRALSPEKALEVKNDIAAKIAEGKKHISELLTEKTEIQKHIGTLKAEVMAQGISLEENEKELENLRTTAAPDTDEIKKLVGELATSETAYESKLAEYEDLKKRSRAKVDEEVVGAISIAMAAIVEKRATLNHNDEINSKIAGLRREQTEYEQARADAEATLDEISTFNRFICEQNTENINKHFNVVTWKLFDFLKNGNYTEVCEAYIDGFKLGESANTGRELLAKIDVAQSLQSAYQQNAPLFVDGFECLSEDSVKKIKATTQLIGLKVTEDDKLTMKGDD